MSESCSRGSIGPSPLMSCTNWVTTRWRSSGLRSVVSVSPVSRNTRSWVASASLSRFAIFDMSSDLMIVG